MSNTQSQILVNLGSIYISDFIKDDSQGQKYPLEIVIDQENKAARLSKAAPLNTMFGKYWYRSGINQSMRTELQAIVESITKRFKLKPDDIWLDIACNDGTLLSYVPNFCKRIGIDPADDSFVNESKQHADVIIQDFFSKEAYNRDERFTNTKANVITCIAMYYDLDDPYPFTKDLADVLDKDGLLVFQLSYTPLMLEQLAFDNICHEHIYYHSVQSLTHILGKCGLQIVDVELNDVNGGSFRVYAMHVDGDITKYGTAPYRDVSRLRVDSLNIYENYIELTDPETWISFQEDIDRLKQNVVGFIKEQKKLGKTIWGYGASTKGNTLLQYFGLDNTLIDAIADKSHYKWDLKTIGTNIPIKSEKEMREAQPDYLLILPWHFISEFKDRERVYLQNGGKFIVPCPRFKVISHDSNS